MRSTTGIDTATCIYGEQEVVAPLIEAAAAYDVRLAVASMPRRSAEPFVEWLSRPAAATVTRLRRLAIDTTSGSAARPLVIAWVFPEAITGDEQVARRAAVEALRGIVQSITREKESDWPPTNGIAAERRHLASVVATVAFLGEPSAAFTAGATFDLTSELGEMS